MSPSQYNKGEGRHTQLATNYPSDYDNRSRVQPGISREGRSAAPARRPASGARPSSGQRSASSQRPSSGQRTSSGQRPAYGQRPSSGQRPASARRAPQASRKGGRRKQPNRMPLFAALAAVVVLVLVLVIAKPFSKPTNVPTTPQTPSQPAFNEVQTPAESVEVVSDPASLSDKLADMGSDLESLSADEMAQVSDLKIYQGLPEEWLNILLMGTDERTLNDSARTDALLICSINRNTGEVKLTSIMRDLAVELKDIGKWSGTYRINAANYFGGPNLAIRTVNEYFNMNIQYYAMVNYFGFQKIAQRLGGIDIDITEAEKDKINEMVVEQYKFAVRSGVDEPDQENVFLETYGENTHLNGRMTLAYARIRKLTGGDAMRTERQRIVLEKLLEKVKTLDAMQMASLASEMIGEVKTNLPFNDIFNIAVKVASNGLNGLKGLRLPIAGTYKEEYRNDQSMLYDCDFAKNALELYNFIYEN